MHRSTPAGSQSAPSMSFNGSPKRKTLKELTKTTLLRFLRVFADEHHHLKEESVLFPELMRISQAEAGPYATCCSNTLKSGHSWKDWKTRFAGPKPLSLSFLRTGLQNESGITFKKRTAFCFPSSTS
jgi:hypothetical protein